MSLVDYSLDGAVAVITLNRPPVNALSAELRDELMDAAQRASDPAVRAVVVTGSPHFAAGADIKAFKAAMDAGEGPDPENRVGRYARAIELLEKPVIAAVRGYALGGGLELAMACDLRFMADDAKVGQPEILLGILPGAGGTQRLARIVGFQRALELCLSGRHIDAHEAHAIGLADLVLPGDELLDTTMARAREFAAGPTRAYAAVKHAVRGGFGLPLEDALAVEREAFNGVFSTDDAKEGVAAFVEKRQADFQGR